MATDNKPKKPWFNDGWTEADLDEFEWIANETEELNQRQATLNKRAKKLNEKLQRQRETGAVAA